MKQLITLFQKHREIIMYLIIGGATTVFSWVTYALFVAVIPMVYANILSWFVTILFAYITNKLLVFQSYNWEIAVLGKEFVSFFASRAATGVIEIFAQPALYAIGLNQSFLGVKGFVSKVLVSIIVIILNYIFSKLFVFKK